VSARRITVVSLKRAALSVVGQSPVTRLSRNLLISPFISGNRPRQVSGTSDASKTQSGLTRTYKGFRAFGLASGAVASDGKSGTRVCADDGFGMSPDRHLQWISQKC
jgi:hypothetical protein